MMLKRKSDASHDANKKKSRFNNDQNETSKQSKNKETISSLPDLPHISLEYESQVFTHQSVVPVKHSDNQLHSYERLEFLGDGYLEIMATRLICSLYKTLSAGRLSQIREILVKNETLSEFSVKYGFDKKIRILHSFAQTVPKTWTKITGDVFEAYIAAVILSDPVNGFEKAEEWMTQLWLPKLKDVNPDTPNLKVKEELSKKILGKGIRLKYVEESPLIQHQGGIQTHFIGVYLTGWGYENQHLGSGTGLSKSGAGNEAAAKALENKPLIDEIAAKRKAFMDEVRAKSGNDDETKVPR